MRTLIIGYGNPMRGDDALGWRVAEELARSPNFAEAEVLSCHQLAPELAERISRVQAVFFIDATIDGTPGEVQCREMAGPVSPLRFTHEYAPDELLGLSRALYGAAPKGFVFTMGGKCFEHGEGLSPAVSARIPEVISRITKAIEDIEASLRSTARPASAAK